MKRITGLLVAGIVAFGTSGLARAQVLSLQLRRETFAGSEDRP